MKKEKKDTGYSEYQIKFTIDAIDPPIWRSVRIPGSLTLGDLHYVIQALMDWEDEHLHEFAIGKQIYGPADMLDDEVLDEDEVTLAMLLGSTRKKFTYLYDFGDDWRVTAEIEKRLKGAEELQHPVCVAGARRGPSEAGGGPWRYLAALEVLENPEHPEYDEVQEWLGDDWDPEYFNLDELNEVLAELNQTRVPFDDMDEDERDALFEQMLDEDPFLEERIMRLHNKIAEVYGIDAGDDMHAFVEKMGPDELKHFAETHLAGNPVEAAHEFGLLALAAEDLDEKTELAEKALELDPQNVDARIVLANNALLNGDEKSSIKQLREAVSVAEARLGKKFFLQYRGSLGERIEARPYLRARQSVARALRFSGKVEEATRVYEDLLDLDREDCCGAHYGLIGVLLAARKYHQARVLIDRFQEDDDPALAWASVLVQYATLGAKAATGELEDAIAQTPQVATCLLDPDTLDDLDLSSIDGHIVFVALDTLGQAWQECPGALEWLSSFVYGGEQN